MNKQTDRSDGLLARAVGFGVGRTRAGLLAVAAAALAFAPLVLLTDRGNHVQVSLFRDYAAMARLLVALPLLILCAPHVHGLIEKALEHTLASPILSADQRKTCDRWVSTLNSFRTSRAAGPMILLIAVSVSVLHPVVPGVLIGLEGWGYSRDGTLKPAGLWHGFVGMTLLRLALLTWLWRIALWIMFLGGLAFVHLKPNPAHPDGSAGLGYLGFVQQRLTVLLFIGGALLAGIVANRIAHLGEALQEHFVVLASFVALGPALLLLPLLLITPTLLRAKRDGIFAYGRIGQDMADAFHRNWVRGQKAGNDDVLESPNPSAVADFGAVHGTVQSMSILPIGKWAVASMALSAAAPLTVLILFQTPLELMLRSALLELPPFDMMVSPHLPEE